MEGLNEGKNTIVNSNIGATVKVENFENFDLSTNSAPIFTIVIITTVYFAVLLMLRKKDKHLRTTTQTIRTIVQATM
jgi:hypothetical protein